MKLTLDTKEMMEITVDFYGRIIIESQELLSHINGAAISPTLERALGNFSCSNTGC